MKTRVEDDNDLGRELLSNADLTKAVRWNTKATFGLGILTAAAFGLLASGALMPQKPMLLDTETGQIITDYMYVLSERTVQERMLLARLTYEGLRRRTGIAEVDGNMLGEWKGQITRKGASDWNALGDRWANLHFVEPGVRRNVEVLSVMPDKANPYSFTIDSVEKDIAYGEPRSEKTYRVRFTMYFTDPEKEGVSKLDGIVLHSEESVR